MPAARAHSPGSGNGGHGWLKSLILEIQGITRTLEDLTMLIRSMPDPTIDEVGKAHGVVLRLVFVIEYQINRRRWELIRRASTPDSAQDLETAIDSLVQSGQDAIDAIDVYKQTLDLEHQKRRNDRRSNPSHARDQKILKQLRREAAVALANLAKESAAFAGAIPL